MAQQHINLGTPPQGVDGDTDRQAWVKAEANFSDLYAAFGGQSPAEVVAQVEQNTADIATLKPQVATNATNIGALQTNDSTQDGRLTAVENKNTAQDASIAANTAALVNLNPLGGFKNKIINGRFDWWQRATYLQSSSFNGYVADRWKMFAAGSQATAQQGTIVGSPLDGVVPCNPWYFMRVTVASVAGAANGVCLSQFIEDVRTTGGRTITVSFWAKADAARNMAMDFSQNFGTGGGATVDSIGAQKIALTNVWQQFKITVTLPTVVGKTTGGGSWYAMTFWFDAGSNFAARSAGLGQQSGYFDITQVQLEDNPTATPFEMRPYPVELALCQRYYEKSYPIGVLPGATSTQDGASSILISGVSNAANIGGSATPFKVTKRVSPTFTAYSTVTGAAGKFRDNTNNVDVTAALSIGINGFLWWATMGAASTWLNMTLHWTADAEM